MQKVNMYLVVIVCASAMITGPALGSFMTYNGMGLNSQVRVNANGHLADGLKVQAGQLQINYENWDYLAYCVDLDHYAGSADVTELDITSINNGDLVAWLYDTYAEGVNSGVDAAALSVAIWEVVYESDDIFDAGTGTFSISENQDVEEQANDLLESLGCIPSSYTPSNGLMVLHSESDQDVMVPEPSMLGLLSIGAVGFLVKRHTPKR